MKRLYPVTIRSRILHRHPGSALTSQAAARPLASTRRDCRSGSCNPAWLANFLRANVRLPRQAGLGNQRIIIANAPARLLLTSYLTFDDGRREGYPDRRIRRRGEAPRGARCATGCARRERAAGGGGQRHPVTDRCDGGQPSSRIERHWQGGKGRSPPALAPDIDTLSRVRRDKYAPVASPGSARCGERSRCRHRSTTAAYLLHPRRKRALSQCRGLSHCSVRARATPS